MKASMPLAALAAVVKATGVAIESKPTMPVLAGVRLTHADAALEMSSFDFETAVRCTVTVDGIDETAEPSTLIVSHRLLASIVSVASTKTVDLITDGGMLLVRAGRAEWRLPSMPVDHAPDLPRLPALLGEADAGELAAAAATVAPAAGSEPAFLEGTWVQVAEDMIEFAATDRFRVHSASAPFAAVPDVELGNFLVPAARLAKLTGLVSGAVSVHGDIHTGAFALRSAQASMWTRTIDDNAGKWVPWRDFAKRVQQPAAVLIVDRDELMSALKQAVVVTSIDSKGVLLTAREASVSISLGNDASGAAASEIDADLTGRPYRIAIDAGFLSSALMCSPAGPVQLNVDNPLRPLVGIGDPDAALSRHVVIGIKNEASGWLDDDG